jgi:SAM-dependent methyltransferase
VSEYWDAEAATFDDEPDHGLRDPVIREAWQTLLRSHLPDPPARVAEMGSATGTLTLLLAEDGHAVDAVDFSPEMVRVAREKVGDRASIVLADASEPPHERAAYDVVLCRHVLWALPDPAAALRTWIGLLRPTGTLLLVEGSWHTGAGLTAAQTEELVKAAGREPTTYRLDDPQLWGGPITDERYLVVG